MKTKYRIQLICIVGVVFSSMAIAQDDLKQRVDDLEQALHNLKGSLSDSHDRSSTWIDRIRISGNADFTYMNGEKNSRSSESRLIVDNARLFFDVDLSDTTSFYSEWDIARDGQQKNEFGQLYLRLDHLFDVNSLNVKVGSMPIPFGEEYLRFHEQRFENPLISFSVPAPYNWDEGIEVFGGLMGNRLEYVVAVMDGDDEFGENSQEDVQIVGRFTIHPTAWSRLVFSALDSGGLGTSDKPGVSALEFGGSHAYTIHGIGDVPNFQNGAPIPDDPSTTLTLTAWEIDAIASHGEWGRVWAAYGSADIDSDGPSSYDRQLQYWIAEGVMELGPLSNYLKRYYMAARYSAIGTFDSDEGFLLGKMNGGTDLGFNTESVTLYSFGLGARIHKNLKLKIEYSLYDFDLVNGATDDIRERAENRDQFGISLSARF